MKRVVRVRGVACLAGSTIPIAEVYALRQAGESPVALIQRFPGLTWEMIDYAMAYESRRQARRSPAGRCARTRGRIQKQRGYRAEKQLEARLAPFGFARMPLSGALGGRFAGDLRRTRDDRAAVRIVEVKRRAGGQAVWRGWLAQGGAHLLVVVPGGGQEPLAVLELQTVEALFREAGYTTAPQEDIP